MKWNKQKFTKKQLESTHHRHISVRSGDEESGRCGTTVGIFHHIAQRPWEKVIVKMEVSSSNVVIEGHQDHLWHLGKVKATRDVGPHTPTLRQLTVIAVTSTCQEENRQCRSLKATIVDKKKYKKIKTHSFSLHVQRYSRNWRPSLSQAPVPKLITTN